MPVTIHLKRNGPLPIDATDAPEMRVVDADGREITPARGTVVTFCRRGAWAIKPFCDGSHQRVGFQSDEVPAAPPGSAGEPAPLGAGPGA